MLPNNKEQEIAAKIGKFFVGKFSSYEKARDFLEQLQITRLFVYPSLQLVILYTRRPGLLIGIEGETIVGLQKHLELDVHIVEETVPCIVDWMEAGFEFDSAYPA